MKRLTPNQLAMSVSLSLLSTSLLATPDDDTLGSVSLEDLLNIEVTTASRSKESAQDAPGTLVVIPASTIRERGYRHLEDVLKDLPGFEVQSQSDAQTFNRVTIRGITANNKFVILQNGIRISSPTGEEIPINYNFPLYHVKQIEVVYGPASALYGADAFTGVINIITHQDPESATSSVAARTGSDGLRYADFHYAHAFSEDLKLFVGGHTEEGDHQNLAAIYPNSYPANDLVTFGGNTVVNGQDRVLGEYPTKSKSLFANLLYADTYKLGFNKKVFRHSTAAGDTADIVDYGQFPHWQTEIENIYSTFRVKFNDELSSDIQISYSTYEVAPTSSFTNIFTEFVHGYKYAKGSEFELGQQFYYNPSETTQIIVGYVWEQFSSLPKTADLPFPFNPDVPTASQNFLYGGTDLPIKIFRIDYDNTGAFVQWREKWTDKVSSVFGLRYDDSSTYGNTLNPRAGLVFKATEKLNVKVLYGEAFLAPSPLRTYEHFGSFVPVPDANGIYQSFFFQIPNIDLEPEEMQTLEINANYRATDNLNITLTVYQEEAENLIGQTAANPQQPGFIPGGNIAFTQFNDNIGSLEATGADLSFIYQDQVGDGTLNLWGSFSYVDGDFDQGSGIAALPFTAKNKLKLGSTYRLGSWFISPSIHNHSKTAGSEIGNLAGQTVDSYTLVNLYTGFDNVFENFSIFFRVNNLLDEEHFHAGLGGLSQLEVPQETRTYEATFRYNF
ncbi:TonB-dependent siderophore receptor [Pleionea sp. CnH1-48]|uniref:TonB-dependent receptor plug domain-containing protein n=1 Tax=Pleionea sp. CnH1-48 TaxID=2954494 RepID=UPI0020973F73|nr:TonB-dependent receptor [Pleionea sp. CnH1-48]MCO7223922.1 TonB-dependent receptor [Pleionea sp. CnH1-48]